MKIAIISDIHGNLEALKAVLKYIEERRIDKIYCLGDFLARGNFQQECFDLLKDRCEVIIQGNCDEHFAGNPDLTNQSEIEINRVKWNKTKTNPETQEFLRNLPFCHEFYMSGRLVRLVHAHPQSIGKVVASIDNLDKLYEMFLPTENTVSQEKADILICGHTHMPYIQKLYNRYIINTGSVGNQLDVFRNKDKDGDCRNTTNASYLVLTGNLDSRSYDDSISFELVNVPYDIDKELENNIDNPEYDALYAELKEGQYRDMKRIEEFYQQKGIKF